MELQRLQVLRYAQEDELQWRVNEREEQESGIAHQFPHPNRPCRNHRPAWR